MTRAKIAGMGNYVDPNHCPRSDPQNMGQFGDTKRETYYRIITARPVSLDLDLLRPAASLENETRELAQQARARWRKKRSNE